MSSSLDTLLRGLPRTLIRAPSASVAAGAGFLPARAIGGHGIAVTGDRALEPAPETDNRKALAHFARCPAFG